jgi:hypothetical protein
LRTRSDLLFRGNRPFEPCKKELIPHRQDDGTDKKSDGSHGQEPADGSQKDDCYGDRYTAPQQHGFQHVVNESDHDAPEQKQHGLRRARDREHVDDSRNEYETADLKHGAKEEDHRPQSGAGQPSNHEAQASKNRLNDRDTKNAVGDAPNRGSREFFKLRPLATEKALSQRTRDCGAPRCIRDA